MRALLYFGLLMLLLPLIVYVPTHVMLMMLF